MDDHASKPDFSKWEEYLFSYKEIYRDNQVIYGVSVYGVPNPEKGRLEAWFNCTCSQSSGRWLLTDTNTQGRFSCKHTRSMFRMLEGSGLFSWDYKNGSCLCFKKEPVLVSESNDDTLPFFP